MAQAQALTQNAANAALVRQQSIKKSRVIYSGSVDPASQNQLQIPFANAGLIQKFIVEVSGVIKNNSSTTALTRTIFGGSNILSNVTLNDYQNNQRVNCSGRVLYMTNSRKAGQTLGAVLTPALPVGFGSNYAVYTGAASIAASGETPVRFVYEVEAAYSAVNLQGAIFAAITNQSAYLNLTINPNPVSTDGTPLNAVYASGAAGQTGQWKAATPVTVTVTQVFWDQLPMDNSGNYLLPYDDISTAYELKETALSGISPNQDFPYALASGYNFISLFAVYQNGTGASPFNAGTDINYWRLESASSVEMFRKTPLQMAYDNRKVFYTDLPLGSYLFDFSMDQINTVTWGNMNLNLNASSAAAGSVLLVGAETMRKYTSGTGMSSLAAG